MLAREEKATTTINRRAVNTAARGRLALRLVPFTTAVWTRVESEVWLHYRSKTSTCLRCFQSKTLRFRQQVMYIGMRAVLSLTPPWSLAKCDLHLSWDGQVKTHPAFSLQIFASVKWPQCFWGDQYYSWVGLLDTRKKKQYNEHNNSWCDRYTTHAILSPTHFLLQCMLMIIYTVKSVMYKIYIMTPEKLKKKKKKRLQMWCYIFFPEDMPIPVWNSISPT